MTDAAVKMGVAAFALTFLVAGAASAGGKGEPKCRVAVGEVKDIRPDPTMGTLWKTVVAVPDPAAWTRDGFKGLSENDMIELVPADSHPDVTLNVELVKSYVEALATAESATVVLRVTFTGRSPAGPKVYRGVQSSTRWTNGQSEAQGDLGTALGDAVKLVSADVTNACLGQLH